MKIKPVLLTGEVVRFSGNGRKLGYPTANIRSTTTLAEGVYFGFAGIGHRPLTPALIFIGVPITVGDSEKRIEVHILDIPDIDYYRQQIEVSIVHFWRPNKKFANLEVLKTAMSSDEKHARMWFDPSTLAKKSDIRDT